MAYSLGLDLGTTYAVAAVARGGRVEVVTLGHRATAIPTVLHLDGETVLVGDAAARRATTEPGRVAREFKRRVGGAVPVIVDGRPFAAEALLACVARWLLDEVTRSEGEAPVALTITYPATWQGHRLALLRDAMAATGVRAVGGAPAFLDEPTAAATYYAQHRPIPPGGLLAVYDLGGGTFDATVVRRTERGFEVVGTPAGLDRVGGLDVDQAVFDHVLAAVGLTADDLDAASPEVAVAVERLRGECVVAKEALSSDTAVTIPVLLPGRHAEVRLTRAELEDLVRPLLDETVGALAHALESAKVAPADLVGVLLVGGSSRIPLVAQLVAAAVGAPVLTDARPKDVTAMGAAVHQGAAAVTPVLPPPSPPLPPPPRLPPPSLPPPSLPPPPPAAGNAVRWIAAAVAAVAVLVGAALAVAASGGGGGDDPPDGGRSAIEATTTASSGATTTTVPVAIFAVAAGDCLAVVPAAGELEQEAQLADCEGQHQGEAFATFTYAGGDEAPYPGDDAVREEGLARCTEAFAEFIGITFEESVLQVRVFRPSSASWRLGDRVAYCVVHEDGAPIVGSLEGSRR